MKTLIIDDGIAHSGIAEKLMIAYGECDIANTGEKGLEKYRAAFLEQTPYDLILLDIVLPGINGHEVINEIRRFEEMHQQFGSAKVKIVMMSAREDNKTIMQSFREQCEGYIIKPITRKKVLKWLHELELLP